ncbi:VOC family protein [Sphingomonas sp. MMSM20]|uniref:VOC family protein n=1 Tax=Sphingomonas lycopersici TaxID=2951807 RepID=UPI00223781DB|nr:VOC family protein [Sphingomonas lycopersici]MCW6530772.1 VOC family protein [Sphingomonas lycopersici]
MIPPVEPIVRADAIARVSFERSDPVRMARFLADFGFVPLAPPAEGRQYFRGCGPASYCVEVIAGTHDVFLGFALSARSRDDLHALARFERRGLGPAEGPGGGERLRLHDPDGHRVDLLWGAETLSPLSVREPLAAVNLPNAATRINRPVRSEPAPAPVFRIGHVVLQTPRFGEMMDWYRTRFGFLASDIATIPDGTPVLGFFRFDRGEEPADHHSLALLAGPDARLLHVSAETIDLDAIGQGQQHLRAQGWNHHWGIGRHVLGSQIFDYWKDNAGDEWEHYADGDIMTADYPTGFHPLSRAGLWAWGDDLPDSMRPPGPLPADAPAQARAIFEALSVAPRPWLR